MRGLDLSKFRKVSSDKDSSTLKHSDGHTLKIAHNGLSSKMKEELDKLPIHKAQGGMANSSNQSAVLKENTHRGIKRFADGGDASSTLPQGAQDARSIDAKDFDSADEYVKALQGFDPNISQGSAEAKFYMDKSAADRAAQSLEPKGKESFADARARTDAAPQQAVDLTSTQQSPAPAVANMAQASTQDAGSDVPDASIATSQDSLPQVEDTTASSNQPVQASVSQDQVAPEQPISPADKQVAVRQDLISQDQAWQQDLANQHITPETYSSLFAKKDTLGRIGTIFGMLMSGAGSGLSHQPNALLGLMQKEIDNDLQAQTQSKSNAQNFLRLNQQHQLQDAQIAQMRKQGNLTDAQAKEALASANTKAFAFSNMQANRATLHSLTVLASKLPMGSPQRQQAEQTLAMLSQAVQSENYNIADQAAAKSAYLNQIGINMAGEPAASGAAQGQGSDTSAQLRKMQALGYINENQYGKANEELKMVQNKQQANQGALDSFNKVASMATIGNKVLNPIQSGKQIDAEWDPMLDKLTKSNEGRVTPITVDMMNGIKPAIGDSAQTTAIKKQKLNEILNAGYSTPILDGLRMSPNKSVPGQQSDTVAVIDAQGRQGKIPRANLQKALKQGYKQVQ